MFSSWFTKNNNDTELIFTPFISQKLEQYLSTRQIQLNSLSTNCIMFSKNNDKFILYVEPKFKNLQNKPQKETDNNIFFELKINEQFYPHRKTLKQFTKWLIDNNVDVSLNQNLNNLNTNIDSHFLEFKNNDETILISINEEHNISFSSYPITSFRKLV